MKKSKIHSHPQEDNKVLLVNYSGFSWMAYTNQTPKGELQGVTCKIVDLGETNHVDEVAYKVLKRLDTLGYITDDSTHIIKKWAISLEDLEKLILEEIEND